MNYARSMRELGTKAAYSRQHGGLEHSMFSVCCWLLLTQHGPVLAVALTTGMRPSEYLALKWHIEWVRRTVSVVRSVRRLNGRWCFTDTKRSRSRRVIKLQNWIVALLRDLRTTTTANNSCPEAADLMFKTASGQPINSDCLAKRFKSILQLAGLPRIRLYDLRHTAATLALVAGVPPKWYRSNWDTRVLPLRWISMLMCYRTCKTRQPRNSKQCSLHKKASLRTEYSLNLALDSLDRLLRSRSSADLL